jgi:hypothetical protein
LEEKAGKKNLRSADRCCFSGGLKNRSGSFFLKYPGLRKKEVRKQITEAERECWLLIYWTKLLIAGRKSQGTLVATVRIWIELQLPSLRVWSLSHM